MRAVVPVDNIIATDDFFGREGVEVRGRAFEFEVEGACFFDFFDLHLFEDLIILF